MFLRYQGKLLSLRLVRENLDDFILLHFQYDIYFSPTAVGVFEKTQIYTIHD